MRLATLLLIALAAPAAAAQDPAYAQIIAVADDPYSDAWADGVERILLARYDRNRSGTLNTVAEVDAVSCGAWEAMQDAIPLGVLGIYGFDPGFTWIGSALGFDEVQRARAFAAGTRCLGGIALAAQIGGIADPSSAKWKAAVGRLLVSEYDADGSGALGGDEATAVPCDVWRAVEAGHAQGEFTRFWISYGFEDGLIWNTSDMGFDESARAAAYADMQACPRLFADAEATTASSSGGETSAAGSSLMPTFTQRLDNELATTDVTLRSGEYVDTWVLYAAAGQQLTVEVASTEFDPYVILKSPSGQQYDNDDWAGSTSLARIVHDDAEEGQWQVLATSYRAGVTGAYGVTLSAAYPSDGLSSPTTRAALVGTMWAEDCPGSNPARSYLRLDADGTFAWSHESAESVSADGDDTWEVEDGQLVVGWNSRYALSRYRLDGSGILSGTTSMPCGSAIRLLRLP